MPLKYVFLGLFFAGFWPVWKWYWFRTIDASDEPWGLFSLITLSAFLFLDRAKDSRSSCRLPGKMVAAVLSVGLSLYLISTVCCPSLVQALLAAGLLWFLISAWLPISSTVGALGLLLLSLPAVSSLNFFVGYPLRVLISAGASIVLKITGLAVTQQGTMLSLNEQLISVDAPCSGVNMLWASAYLASLSMCLCRLTWRGSLILAGATLLMVVLLNILRVAALSYFAVRAGSLAPQMTSEQFVHTGTGLTAFVLLCAGIAWLALRLRKEEEGIRSTVTESSARSAFTAKQMIVPALLSATAIFLPLLSRPPLETPHGPVAWPAKINGNKLTARNGDDAELNRFARGFPGEAKQFTDGKNAYLVCRVSTWTRQLHPSSDCFKGMGYQVEFGPILKLQDGSYWASFSATKTNVHLRILERICDEHGCSWTDVSEWYWSALAGRTKGPWWHIVIAQPG